MFLAFVTVTALHLDVGAAGGAWLLTGIAVYMAYRRNQGLDLTSTFKVAVPASTVDHEAEYDSVLVAFDERG
jgi:APA family basic amino acid/polyamine antiporter